MAEVGQFGFGKDDDEEVKGVKNFCAVNLTIELTGFRMEQLIVQSKKQKLPCEIEEGALLKLKFQPTPADFQKYPKKKCSCSCVAMCRIKEEKVGEFKELLDEEIADLPKEELKTCEYEFMSESAMKDLMKGSTVLQEEG